MIKRYILARSIMLWAGFSFIMFVVSASIAPAFAITTQMDLSVGMKTLPLLSNKIIGTANIAIVFDPAIAASKQEADGIKALLDGGFAASADISLVGTLVPVDDLSKMAGSKIAILTNGLSAHYDAISNAAVGNEVLTMSTDLNCVQAHKCILGIVSKPHVEIYYSQSAADAAKISFGQVFIMLVKQI